MMVRLTPGGFNELARPALLWLAVFVNVVFCVVISVLLVIGRSTLAEATGLITVQLAAVTAPATTYVFQRSQERKADFASRRMPSGVEVHTENTTIEEQKNA